MQSKQRSETVVNYKTRSTLTTSETTINGWKNVRHYSRTMYLVLFVSSIKVEYAAKSPFSSDHGNWLIHSRKRAWAKQHVGWRWIVSYVRWRTGNRNDLYLQHRGYPYGRKTCSECPSLSFRPTESSLDQNSARLGQQAAWTAGIEWPPPWHSQEKNGKRTLVFYDKYRSYTICEESKVFDHFSLKLIKLGLLCSCN